MKSIAVDGSNNIILSNYNLSFKTENESVAQRVRGRLELWLGEYFLDTSLGTPYLEQIFGVNRYQTLSAAIKQQIVADPEVLDITQFSVTDPDVNRHVVVVFSFTTIYNATISNQTITVSL